MCLTEEKPMSITSVTAYALAFLALIGLTIVPQYTFAVLGLVLIMLLSQIFDTLKQIQTQLTQKKD